jgi:hypothetical protein
MRQQLRGPTANGAGGTGDPEQWLRSHRHAGEIVLPGGSATFTREHPRELGVGERPQQRLGLGRGRFDVTLDHAFGQPAVLRVVTDEPAADAMETHRQDAPGTPA